VDVGDEKLVLGRGIEQHPNGVGAVV
jgi:hypothetical protein